MTEQGGLMKIYGRGWIVEPSRSLFRGYAWPSVACLPDGRLAAVFSGERMNHVCPFGKVMISYSEDEGETWTPPATALDTPLDERDAGICVCGGKVYVTTFNNSVHFQRMHLNKYPGDWTEEEKKFIRAYLHLIPPEEEERWLGSLCLTSEGGYSFGELQKLGVSAPHGMIALSDGTLLYVGNRPQYETKRFRTDHAIYYIRSKDGVNWTKRKKVPLENAGNYLFCEPHAIQTREGFLIALRRQCSEGDQSVFDTWLIDADKELKHFSNQRKVTDGAPPHLYRKKSGDIVLTYGYRTPPFGQRARISHDEGRTWSEELVLDSEGISWDLGYPATAERTDGKLLTVYYQKKENSKYPGIRYCIWDA